MDRLVAEEAIRHREVEWPLEEATVQGVLLRRHIQEEAILQTEVEAAILRGRHLLVEECRTVDRHLQDILRKATWAQTGTGLRTEWNHLQVDQVLLLCHMLDPTSQITNHPAHPTTHQSIRRTLRMVLAPNLRVVTECRLIRLKTQYHQ